MGCCGKARETIRQEYASVTPVSATAGPPHGVAIHYLNSSPVLIRLPRTGHSYTFRPGEADQLVDPLDAEVLIRTGLFRVPGM